MSAPHGIKVGDVVRLKSGSPLMTVIKLWPQPQNQTDQMAGCAWFDPDGIKTHYLDFPPDTLVVIPPEPKP